MIVKIRVGDIASSFANTKKAKEILVFEAKLGLDDMCKSSFNWKIKNTKGYGK